MLFESEQTPVPSALPPVTVEGLQKELLSLRYQFAALIVILLVFSGTLDIYLLRQWIALKRQNAELRSIVVDYEKNRVPAMENLTARLRDFGRTHPDFEGILHKYFQPAAASQSNAPAANPPAKR